MLLTGALDFATQWIRLSVILGWITPRTAAIRKLFFPLPSLPVDPAMAIGATSGYAINVAPMVLTYLLGWARDRCGRMIAARMAAARQIRRDERRRARGEKED